eukprot:TRINITY_DN16882_c0_g1_i2.p1 TRINITY_DN16882_c0_g1~~TRINITY_DN16882_c0_g1_i2.p1  ORF type:complete len:438 (-),score=104.38 TRINITY_DN16882_c0_g1_i2:70-1335(-)
MDEEGLEQMEVGDTDEGATQGKDQLGQMTSEPSGHPESLSSRRVGEDGKTIVRQQSLGFYRDKDVHNEDVSPAPSLSTCGAASSSQAAGNHSTSGKMQNLSTPVKVDGSQDFVSTLPQSLSAASDFKMSSPATVHVVEDSSALNKVTEEADLLFIPDDDQEWMRPKKPPSADSPGPAAVLNGPLLPVEEQLKNEALNEEEEWLERKRVTGVIGRLVQYKKGETPSKDILGLRRTGQGRLMVTAVRGDGPAARAGVVSGDQLISVNGEKIWEYYPAKALLSGVKGPANLVFLGFSGKLQAEVRVKQPDEPRLGLPPQISVPNKVIAKTKREEDRDRRKKAELLQAGVASDVLTLQLKDTVVFEQTANTSLLIATEEANQPSAANAGYSSQADASTSQNTGVYELLQQDAREILFRALKGDFV